MLRTDSVPRVSWEEFLRHFRWEQGEHISAIGPTGSGKTTLIRQLLARRDYVAALATKPADSTMSGLVRKEKFRLIRSWDEKPPVVGRGQKVVLWPKFQRPEDQINQQYQIDRALREMFVSGGWCVFADELFYLCKTLRLTSLLETYWTQGRSLGLSLVGGTQRPAHVPLFAYDQATHLFFWRDNDETNLRRIAGLGGMSAKEIRSAVTGLPKHHALYVNTRDGEIMVTQAPRG